MAPPRRSKTTPLRTSTAMTVLHLLLLLAKHTNSSPLATASLRLSLLARSPLRRHRCSSLNRTPLVFRQQCPHLDSNCPDSISDKGKANPGAVIVAYAGYEKLIMAWASPLTASTGILLRTFDFPAFKMGVSEHLICISLVHKAIVYTNEFSWRPVRFLLPLQNRLLVIALFFLYHLLPLMDLPDLEHHQQPQVV